MSGGARRHVLSQFGFAIRCFTVYSSKSSQYLQLLASHIIIKAYTA